MQARSKKNMGQLTSNHHLWCKYSCTISKIRYWKHLPIAQIVHFTQNSLILLLPCSWLSGQTLQCKGVPISAMVWFSASSVNLNLFSASSMKINWFSASAVKINTIENSAQCNESGFRSVQCRGSSAMGDFTLVFEFRF